MINLEINGRKYQAEEGQNILEVAQREGVYIPTLCYHAGVEAWGGCRICMVEITHKSWKGWKGLVTSCLYPVEEGLQVTTDNEAVHNTRRVVLDLLLARCPDAAPIKKLAMEYGIEKTSYKISDKKTDCILCTLCVRVCASVGACAISTADRGASKMISMPFKTPPPDCIGCLSCAKICPTGVIKYKSEGDSVKIWGRNFEMLKCEACSKLIMTKAQQEYESNKTGLDMAHYALCPDCRKKKFVDRIESAFTIEN